MEILIFGQHFDINLSTFSWDTIYDLFGVKEFMHFIMNPALQDMLFPAKVVFILFTLFFLYYVMYFYVKSSYLHYNFFQQSDDMVALRPAKAVTTQNRWKKIMDKAKSGQERDYKFAIIEADDFLQQLLESKGFKGDDFGALVRSAKKNVSNVDGLVSAHELRNSIVYDSDYKLDNEDAQRALAEFEKAVRNLSAT